MIQAQPWQSRVSRRGTIKINRSLRRHHWQQVLLTGFEEPGTPFLLGLKHHSFRPE
jgi:hypothetical protein